MKKEVYICDNCGQILSDPIEEINKKHLSINFASCSGWVQRGFGLNAGTWRHFKTIEGIKQFCGAKCIGDYFKKLLKEN